MFGRQKSRSTSNWMAELRTQLFAGDDLLGEINAALAEFDAIVTEWGIFLDGHWQTRLISRDEFDRYGECNRLEPVGKFVAFIGEHPWNPVPAPHAFFVILHAGPVRVLCTGKTVVTAKPIKPIKLVSLNITKKEFFQRLKSAQSSARTITEKGHS